MTLTVADVPLIAVSLARTAPQTAVDAKPSVALVVPLRVMVPRVIYWLAAVALGSLVASIMTVAVTAPVPMTEAWYVALGHPDTTATAVVGAAITSFINLHVLIIPPRQIDTLREHDS